MQSTQYFARQVAIPEFGVEGLRQLQSKCVGIAGVGGVGSAAAYYLAKSGIGKLLLVDQDIVDPSNLQRVHMLSDRDLYHPKAEAIASNLQNDCKATSTKATVDTITDRNVDRLLGEADLMFDGLDNFRTRYVLNRFAARSHTPYMFVSAVSQQAHIALLEPPERPCLECFMPGVKDRTENSCEILGVTPTITGLAGAIGAAISIKHLLGKPTELSDHILTVDLDGPDFVRSRIQKRSTCTTCTEPALDEPMVSRIVTSLCGERTANIMPPENGQLQLTGIARKISPPNILLNSDSVLVFRHGPHTVSVFPNGRLLIGEVDEEAQASRIAEEVWEMIANG